MLFCYVDGSGTCDPYVPDDAGSSPVFVLVGLMVSSQRQRNLTMDFIQLKKEFEPQLRAPNKVLSDLVKFEIKGSRVRKMIADGSRTRIRWSLGLLEGVLALLEKHDCRVVGKVIVKDDAHPLDDKTEYAKAIQELAVSAERRAASMRTPAIMILDSRTKVKNECSVQAITTRRFRTAGNAYPHLVEDPLFGHSDTHALLQIADLLASAVIFPIACLEFTPDIPSNRHRHWNYRMLKENLGERLASLEHRYGDRAGRTRGGFRVIDSVHKRGTHMLFRD